MSFLPDLPDESTRASSWHDDDPSPLSQRTWPQPRASTNAQRAAKAVRVHTLTDPLGAKGFRATGKRVRDEASARRKVLLASVATFAASLGVIVATNHATTTASSDAATQAATAPSSSEQTYSSSASSVGAAVDLFTNQTTSGLTGVATLAPTATSAPTQHDDTDDNDESDAPALLSTQASDSSSSQVETSDQSTQAPVFQEPTQALVVQQPSHTRSGGS